jgi:thiamine biosynthesis lipoprotein
MPGRRRRRRRLADCGLDAVSDYREDSELMQLCAKAGGPAVGVSDDLLRVLDAALRLSRRTDGAFDVSVGPVSRIWRRARAAGALPDPKELGAAQRLVGYRHIELSVERRTVRLTRRGMLLDLGGIGKGHAADEALATLPTAARRLRRRPRSDVVVGDPPPETGMANRDRAAWSFRTGGRFLKDPARRRRLDVRRRRAVCRA